MRYLGIIHTLEQAMNRPEDHDYLLALCKNEIPKSEARDLQEGMSSLSSCQK